MKHASNRFRNLVGLITACVLFFYAADELGYVRVSDWILVALGVPVIFALIVVKKRASPRAKRNELAALIYCEGCGYNLRGTHPVDGWVVCPECGYKQAKTYRMKNEE